jgi:hypothetical protein
VLKVEDGAEIRRLALNEGLSIKVICRRLDVARNTVRGALRWNEPPRYQRETRGSLVDAVEPQIPSVRLVALRSTSWTGQPRRRRKGSAPARARVR